MKKLLLSLMVLSGLEKSIQALDALNSFDTPKQSKFVVRTMNYDDKDEIEQVAALFDDPDNCEMTGGKSPEDLKDLIAAVSGDIHDISKAYQDYKNSFKQYATTESSLDIETILSFEEYQKQELEYLLEWYSGYKVFVCMDQANVAGVIILNYDPEKGDDYVYIATVAVNPVYRRQGVASQMLSYVEGLYNTDVERFELCVYKNNPNAIGCYEKFGFRKERDMQDVQKSYVMQALLYLIGMNNSDDDESSLYTMVKKTSKA